MPTENFQRLQQIVLADQSIVNELSGIDSVEQFVNKLLDIASQRNIAVKDDDVRQAIADARRSDRKPSGINCEVSDRREWLPARVAKTDGKVVVEWFHIGNARLTDPFFEDSIKKRRRVPFSLVFRPTTDIEMLKELPVGIPPTGFIFHMSRCGSTLVSQMLAALDANIMVAEAPPIDEVLSISRNIKGDSDSAGVDLLRSVINAFGTRRFPQEKHLFIKLDSWAILDFDVIQKAFPDTPWIFLYRDPVEVVVSHMRQPGMQMIPGVVHAFDDLVDKDGPNVSREEYCARVLERVCSDAVAQASCNGLFVDYGELPSAFHEIVRHFRVDFTPDQMATMMHTTQFDAKTPQMFFKPDSEEKQRQATHKVRESCNRLAPLYERLKSLSRDARSMTALRLDMQFDEARLKDDLALFGPDAWTRHFNTDYYEGEWSGIALRTSENAHVPLYPDPSADKFVDTEELKQCPYILSVLGSFECRVEFARFLRLTAGSEIREHKDHMLGIDDGCVRLHIPIVTDPAVEFYLDGQRIDMKPGELWYLNLNLPHRVKNNSTVDRVHLVLDCVVNDWFTELYKRSITNQTANSIRAGSGIAT